MFRKLLTADSGPQPLTKDRRMMALAQVHSGDFAAALATVEQMPVPDMAVIQWVAAAQAQAGDFAGARTTIAERIPDESARGGAYEGLAYLQARAGQVEEALRWANSLDHRLHRSHALLGVATALEEQQGPKPSEPQPPAKQ
jgi:hypothetical protein